jgi:AsmA protein
VQLAPAMKNLELDKTVQLTGAVNADATANLSGVTMNQLMDSLTSQVNFSGAEWKFAPLNIEQKFCELVDMVNKIESDPTRVWESFTEMRQLTGKITMANRVISVENFNAGVHQLIMGTQGKLDLAKQSYDFTLPLKLLEEETSASGCRVASNYWINRSLSLLRCRGSLEGVNPLRDCGLDSKGLTSLTKDFAEYKLREKHGDKIDAAEKKVDDKKEELLKKLDEKLGGEGDSKRSKDLLKGLLKQATEKSASSSSASSVAE